MNFSTAQCSVCSRILFVISFAIHTNDSSLFSVDSTSFTNHTNFYCLSISSSTPITMNYNNSVYKIDEGPLFMIQDLVQELESCDIMSSKLIEVWSKVTSLLNGKRYKYWDHPLLPISDVTKQWLLHIQNMLSVEDAFYFLSQELNEDVMLEIKRNPELYHIWMSMNNDILFQLGGYYWDSVDPIKVSDFPFFKHKT